MRTENTGRQPSHRQSAEINATSSDHKVVYPTQAATSEPAATKCVSLPCTSSDQVVTLSCRAHNVLKELASELTGETPPQGEWSPSDLLLQRLTHQHLATARNCGPQTTAEIVQWARTRGQVIEPRRRIGKSLSAMWQDVMNKFASGDLSTAEVAEVLENSTRRRNTRIPIEFQKLLVQFVSPSRK